jgi:hypothetical protein
MDRRLDLEPLEIIQELLLREGAHDTIGGPVQLVKAYRHMNTEPFVVAWRDEPGGPAKRALLGRTLLDYETLDAPTVDVDELFGLPAPGPGACCSNGMQTCSRSSWRRAQRTRSLYSQRRSGKN